jgi:hypothetical protein
VDAIKLSKSQIRELHSHLLDEPLGNYELLWVLESCLETSASDVYGLGRHPWHAGLLVMHRHCLWLKLQNEMLLEALLAVLPKLDLYRFYTTDTETLEMLRRWYPQGQLTQSRLCVRNLTKTWRKRFDVSVTVNADPATVGGFTFCLTGPGQETIATASSQQVVVPWQEIMDLQLLAEQDLVFWSEHVLGAITAVILAEGCPAVIRVGNEELYNILEPLGYREFSQLYYYVAARE